MRKETSNQFTEGLVSDLNPINTPNTVLTDNLNGTVITYNGNEFSLQNDMGNYELKYCRLKPNYIPVGIKEYGDILYIVSYNPLDRHVEIGSYPSPLMITTPDLKNSNNVIDSIIDENIVNLGLPEGSYLELLNKADRIIFNGENFKLNPGDEYCLQLFDKKLYKYETIDYFILDDDAGTFNVTDKIKVDPDNGDPDYEYVPWTIPGWIMIKSRLAELSTSGINIRYFYVPKQEDSKSAYFSLNVRLNVNDPFLTKKNDNDQSILDEWCKGIENRDLKDISFRVYLERADGEKWKSLIESEYVEFSISENSSNLIYLGESGWVEWYDDSRILWKNISGKIKDLKEDDLIRIKITPILSESEYKILYDNLEQTLIFDLAGIDDAQWHVGKSIYKFELNDFETEQIIYTNITGPIVSSAPVSLYYEISDLKGNIVKNGKFDDYFGIGENVLKIQFDENFKSENIYIIKFLFKSDISGEIINESKRFLVTSVIFKDFMGRSIFDKDIAFEEWINKYWEHCKINVNFEYNGYTVGENFERISKLTDGDNKYLSNVLFGRFHLADGSDLSETIFKHYGTYYNVDGSLGIYEQLLEGDLWNGIQSKYTFLYGSETEKQSYIAGDPIRLSCYEEEVYKYHTLNESFDFANMDVWRFDTEEIFADNDPMNRWGAKLELWSIRLKMIFNKDKITCKMQVGTYNDDWDISDKKWTACKTAFGYENEYTLEVETKGSKIGNMKELFESLFLMLPYNIEVCLFEVEYEFQNGRGLWNRVSEPVLNWDDNLEPPFIFGVDTDGTIKNNYFIILRQSEFDYNPILLPLTDSKDQYLRMYRVFCRNLSIITSYENPGIYSEYELYEDSSKIESDLKLNLYLKGGFNSEHKYSDIKLFDRKERSNLILNIGVVYDNIFIGSPSSTYDSTESLIYSHILKSNVFSLDTWHKTRKDEFHNKLEKINLDRNNDYKFFFEESPYGNSLKDRVNELNTAKGFYIDKIISNDPLLIYMSKNYIKTGRCGESYDPTVNKSVGWITLYRNNNSASYDIVFYGNVCKIERDIRLDTYWSWLYES